VCVCVCWMIYLKKMKMCRYPRERKRDRAMERGRTLGEKNKTLLSFDGCVTFN